MYWDCEFITPIEQPDCYMNREHPGDPCIFQTSDTGDNSIADWIHYIGLAANRVEGFRQFLEQWEADRRDLPPTYVDFINPSVEPVYIPHGFDGNYVAIVRGARSERWHASKDPGDEVYRRIIHELHSKGLQCVLVGSEQDNKWWFERMSRWGYDIINMAHDNMRQAMALVQGASMVVSNDTGLYHITAANRTPQYVMWRKTMLPKNLCPEYDGLAICQSDDADMVVNTDEWFEGFEAWFSQTDYYKWNRISQ
jgi:hypothetical protein